MKNNPKHIHFTPKVKVHFMGIGGSGMSAVAMIAHHRRFRVSGCDLQKDTPYLKKLKEVNIPIFTGHAASHLKGVDICAVTPAAFYRSKYHPEFAKAKRYKKLMTWQEVLGNYLHKDKEVICVAGTHGKSTTTAMAALMFERAMKDPSVVIGAKVKEWDANFRFGRGKIFITEADEFFDNFLNYKPQVIVLNNIEFDHPDFFKNEEHVLRSFSKFTRNLVGKKALIINQDSKGIKKLFDLLDKKFLSSLNILGYTMTDKPKVNTQISVHGEIVIKGRNFTSFSVKSSELKLSHNFKIKILGEHNVANALGAIILARINNIDTAAIGESLYSFSGIGRRLELIGTKRGVKVYDDYAHHPTEVAATLEALRQKYSKRKIWVIVEPHSYSRTKTLLKDYKGAFSFSDEVIIGPIFPARDKKTFGISGQSIVEVSGHKNIQSAQALEEIIKLIRVKVNPSDVIVVMGAGESYKWAREIFKAI